MNDINDDNAIYDSADSIDDVVMSLQESTKRIFQWLSDNETKGNTDKCHLILSTNEQLEILIEDSSFKWSSYEKLLGVKIDSKLNFDDHLKSICSKASNILRALARTTPYTSIEKKNFLTLRILKKKIGGQVFKRSFA